MAQNAALRAKGDRVQRRSNGARGEVRLVGDDGRCFVMFDSRCSGWIVPDDLVPEPLDDDTLRALGALDGLIADASGITFERHPDTSDEAIGDAFAATGAVRMRTVETELT